MTPHETHLLRALCAVREPAEMRRVLADLLTPSEYGALLKRWSILRLLRAGVSQREVARRIDGSLCNVTRGARLLHRDSCASAALLERLERADPGLPRPTGATRRPPPRGEIGD